jgi:peptidoglycan hydrolase-like protein with peptidoglycan-binding domain
VSGMRRRKLLRTAVAGGSVVLGAAGVVAAVALNNDDAAASAPASTPVTTAEVVQTDLVSRSELDGTLGYAHTYPITAEGAGRLTWLPEVGAVIRRGQRVYELDGRRVPLFYGSTPLWRSLQSGVEEGKDVLQLERNLKALGYGDEMTVDRDFTSVTAQAVRDWQEDLGVAETGRVEVGDVVMQPGKLRISEVDGVLGSRAGGKVLTATDTVRQVTVDMPVTQQELAKVGQRVRVDLPGGRTSGGKITAIGTAATSDTESEGPADIGEPTDTATVPVYVTLTKPSAAGRLDGAPVTVGFTGEEHRDVLAVPVNALLAGSNGGYSVEVVDGSAHRLVPVELGIFADGQVEVSGPGLEAGMSVEVPRS